jgi:hypothetical protein
VIERQSKARKGIGIFRELTPRDAIGHGIGSAPRQIHTRLNRRRMTKMENDFVTDLHNQREPEQEDCSTGIVPLSNEWAESPVDEQEIIVPFLTSMW